MHGSTTDPERERGDRNRVNPAQLQTLRIRLCFMILVVDCLAIFGGCLLGNYIRFHDPLSPVGINLFAAVLPLYVGIAINSDAYSSEILSDVQTGLSRAILAYVFAVFAVFFLAFYMKVGADMSRMTSGVAIAATFLTLAAARYLCFAYIKLRTGMRLVYDLMICDEVACDAPPHMHVLDTVRDKLRPDTGDPHMLNRLAKRLRGVDRVVIACPPERRYIWSVLLKGSSVNGYILADELDKLSPIGIGSMSGRHTLAVSVAPLDMGRRAAKRILDLAITIPALVFLSPVLLAVAIAIKLDSRGPVFFLQPRVGRGNRLFLVYKFRSMRSDRTDKSGNKSVSKHDDRVTRIGRFIRATSIDELPQLFNILRGDMSLVGPRPHALGSLAGDELFWEVDERYWVRHALKPGLTGLAQVRGYRGETKERKDLADRLNADLEYLSGWTIWRDISILAGTLRVIVHKNAY
ncbi:exopolysaccharide biosynthesis polyprenyl glycosylphosphotransferase [Sphingomonas vulcanisoli]|uniref:Exopolysaccharide biosynthesis polyprenyl glycosylphosphotransferase n=1 Tax=Sphingomonas vulcanisoli TaxID=1658060 RepID=A0ABX0TQC8_9SPHN|nr:exopolysaccharide biosynthesis polyprenyl glycosylphosphotransferase [Sphingomonas vulcanisoli]NIJ07734.1 exopolysaccharide biosynthesis polyprenyl glycosylphosphotransferase [Sphingomonas vulcanisoli]